MKKLERAETTKLKGGRQKLERQKRPPRGMEWPKFDTLFTPTNDPLDGLDLGDDQEENADQVMGRVEGAFIEDEHAKLDAYRTMVNQDFYLVVCFQSSEQKYDFLSKAGLHGLGDLYIDGLKVAKRLGVDIPPIPLQTKESKRMPRLLRDIQTIPKGGDKS